MRGRWAVVVGLLLTAAVAEPPAVDQGVDPVAVPFEVDGAQPWTRTVRWPAPAADAVPVLAVRARKQTPGAAGGCNFGLGVELNGQRLRENRLRPRLINKAPFFDPPNTAFHHFSWYGAAQQGWMTIFSKDFAGDWGGTGQDYDFLWDLSGLVHGGQDVVLGLRDIMPNLASILKVDRAPLVIGRLTYGTRARATVDGLRAKALGAAGLRAGVVTPELPAGAPPGPQAYELTWSGRPQPPGAVTFDDLHGWTVQVAGDTTVKLSATQAQRLWRPRLAALTYAGGTVDSGAVLRPPQPIELTQPFDAINLWLYGALNREKDQPVHVTALLETRAGDEVAVDLGGVTSTYWGLQHGVLPKGLKADEFPLRFVGLQFDRLKVEGERTAYLDLISFYRQNRKPFAHLERANPPVFPNTPNGLRPPAPAGVRVSVTAEGRGARFVSESPAGRLTWRVDPTRGCLDGVTAQWQDGPAFQPLAGGGVSYDGPAGAAALEQARLEGATLTASWRYDTRRWQAVYRLDGRTLTIDLSSPGGEAAGTATGHVAGLPGLKPLEVPYLTYGWTAAPRVAVGGGLFISVLPDFYHSDFTRIDPAMPAAPAGAVALLGGTVYEPLTDGRRNDLRDRLLVTVSPEFADTLPNVPNPPSPNREQLAPCMFVMGHLERELFATMKRYGLDHVIANDFATMFVAGFAEGFADRWRPHPSLSVEQVQQHREFIHGLGYRFGLYQDTREYYPLNEFWDESKVALTADGRFTDAWYGNFHTKPTAMPWVMREAGSRTKKLYPGDCVYLDVHSNLGPAAADFERGVELAGMGRGTVLGNGESILEGRRQYGTTISEGVCRWIYAGLGDMDYAQIRSSRPVSESPLLVDFDLLRLHPLEHGTMMGYAPTTYLSEDELKELGSGLMSQGFYKYVSASLGFGHMLLLGYGYIPPLAQTIHYWALMQAPQREYLTDTVAEIAYHDGQRYLTTSEALRLDRLPGRLRVRYRRGLTVLVNHEAEPWSVELNGHAYVLPRYGWAIERPGVVRAYSALRDGERVDYAEGSEYVYLNTGHRRVREGALEVDGAVLLKREPSGWRLIPCGDLGGWETFPMPYSPLHARDFRLAKIPADRGVRWLAVDPARLTGTPRQVTAVGDDGQAAPAPCTRLDDGRLRIDTTAAAQAYRLQQ